MNDGDYPRVRIPMDFDLMGRDYRPGDRSRREDDRYLFLEALLSARDRLYISWVGKSVRDNTPRPPSVLVGQLRDHIAAGWILESGDDDEDATGQAGATGAAVRARGLALVEALTTEHRLQPFSSAYFPQDRWDANGRPARLFTYAGEWQGNAPGRGQADADLAPPQRDEPLTLRELTEFLKAPVEAFYRQRLQVNFSTDDPTSEDIEPFVPDSLEKWKLQDTLIKAQSRALEAEHDPHARRAAVLDRFGREGVLAGGAFGALIASDLAAPLDDMLDRYTQALERWPDAQEGELPVACGTTEAGLAVQLEDWLAGFRSDEQGERCRLVLETSDLVVKGEYRADRLVGHWVGHIAAQLTGGSVTTTIIDKSQNVDFRPVDPEDARACMQAWLRAWQVGMTRPLPLEVSSAFEWLTRQPSPLPAAYDDSAAREKARNVYEGSRRAPGRVGRSAYLAAVYPDFEALTGSGEFYELARQLLGPMRVALHASKKKNGAKAAKGEGDE
jgi:exodeoxyribonuclease V gamma subunit